MRRQVMCDPHEISSQSDPNRIITSPGQIYVVTTILTLLWPPQTDETRFIDWEARLLSLYIVGRWGPRGKSSEIYQKFSLQPTRL